jgi:hypothetical protein
MSHANAALTPRARLRLAALIVDDRWTYTAAAKMFMVSPSTAKSGPSATAPRDWAGWLIAVHDHAAAPPRPRRR